MTRLLPVFLLALAGVLAQPAASGSTEPSVATQAEFIADWIAALEGSSPTLEVEIVDQLEITARTGELTIRASAEQAYENYLAEPATREDQIAILVSMVSEALEAAGAAPDVSRIVPVIKKAEWLAKYQLDCPYYPLPDELIVVLVEDRPDEIRYLRTADLERLDKSVPELFTAAISNLRTVAPIEEHAFDGFVMLSSGGNYEAGLMLDGALIASYAQRFKGEVVFSAPSADVLVLTGRDDQQGLGGIVRAVCASGDLSASLSSKVFAAREGVLEIVGEVDCSDELPVLTMESGPAQE